MTTLGKKAQFETLRSINATSFTGAYQAIGTPLANPSVWIQFVNNTTVLLTISDDGINDKFTLPIGTILVIDVASDAITTSADKRLQIAQGTQFFVKAVAGTGLLSVASMFVGG